MRAVLQTFCFAAINHDPTDKLISIRMFSSDKTNLCIHLCPKAYYGYMLSCFILFFNFNPSQQISRYVRVGGKDPNMVLRKGKNSQYFLFN